MKLKAIESYVRNIYTIIHNSNSKKGTHKKPQQLWPIPEIDGGGKRLLKIDDFKSVVKRWEESEEFKQKFKLN